MREPITRANTEVSEKHIIPSFESWKAVFVPLFTSLPFERCQTINDNGSTIWAEYDAFDDKLDVCYYRYKSNGLTEMVTIKVSNDEAALIKEMITEAVIKVTGMTPTDFCNSEHTKY